MNLALMNGQAPVRAFVAVFVLLLFPMFARGQNQSTAFDDLVFRATGAREQNDVPRAIELYSQAVQLNPKWSDGWWFLGSLQNGAGSYAAARDALSHYVELTPNAGPAIALRGLCEFETGDYAEALADIQHGMSLGAANQPRNEQILRYHEAQLLTRIGKFEEALKAYAFFAPQRVSDPELLVAVGLAGLRVSLLPKDVNVGQQDLLRSAGNAALQFMAGDQNAARQSFQDFFQRFPGVENAHYLYGYLLFTADPDEAIMEFERELQNAPSNLAAQVMAAWALLMRNRSAEALPYAEKAAVQEPALPAAQLVLGRSLLEDGNLKAGLEHLEKAQQLEPNNLETHIALAKAYSKAGRKEDAQRERRLCLQMAKNETIQFAQP